MRVRPLVLAVLLLLPGFAIALPYPQGLPVLPAPLPSPWACPPAPPGVQLPEVEPYEVALADGAVLRGHVYLRHGAPRPTEVVLELSPYWGLFPGGSGCLPIDERTGHFVAQGYAFAAMSLRGTGMSEGCLQFGSGVDRSDARRVVEALRTATFGNGKVAMAGGSFSAQAVMAALAAGAPLDAAAVFSPAVDWWSVHTRGGAPLFMGDPPQPSALVAAQFVPGVGFNAFGPPGAVNLFPPSHATCPIHAEHLQEDALLLAVGDRTAYWQDRDHRPGLTGTTVPVFFVNGLRNFEEMVTQTTGLWDRLAGEKRFILGQWNHLEHPPWAEEEMLAWFEHHLRGAPPTVPSGRVTYQDDLRAWHNATAWPPGGAEARLLLGDGALLPEGAAPEASAQTFTSLWGNPCLGLCLPGPNALVQPFSYHPVCGPFQALYASPPLAEAVTLAGTYTVAMTLSSTRSAGHLSAYLWQSPSGTCPDPGAREVRRAIGSLRHVFDERGRDFPVNVPTEVALESYPFAAVVPAGQRLVLAIGGEAANVLPSPEKPLLTLHTGPGYVGALDLRVVDGELRFVS